MAVRDDRSDVKQTTTGFRGPLMVQSLTSAKSKFLSLNHNKKFKIVTILHTFFLFSIAASFIIGFYVYFSEPEPIDLIAVETLSYQLKLEYLEKPIKIGYLIKSFSGNPAKVGINFEFHNKSKKLLSRLTYILTGGKDHYNYSNQTVGELNYITYIRKYDTIGKEQLVVFENILNAHNLVAKKINGNILRTDDIQSVSVNLGAWYDNKSGKEGNISVIFYSWDKYIVE